MIRIKNMQDVGTFPEGPVKRLMLARAELCHYGDEEVMAEMEEEFNGVLGGDWYVFEEGDDPHNFEFDVGYPVDLLSEEWNWCDEATLEDGCFFIFWGTNNAGGPCLFVPDEGWVQVELKNKIENFVRECKM